MTSSTLERIRSGARIFIDAPIFIYHFTGASTECRDFLQRCEACEVQGVTSTVTLAEVTHRLMMIEAVMKGLVSPGNVVQKLRKRPEVVCELSLYQEQVDKIAQMEIDILPLDLTVLAGSGAIRKSYGLLTNDSLIVSTARELKISAIASADQDFDRLEEIALFCPGDI